MPIPRPYTGSAALAGALAVAVVVPSVLVSGSTAATPRTPAEPAEVSTVTATGVGAVAVRPDVARMHVQVLREAPTVAEAVERTAGSVRRVAAVPAEAGEAGSRHADAGHRGEPHPAGLRVPRVAGMHGHPP